MPDVHAGVGMTIGGVLAGKGAVIPNAVGVDIGCQKDLEEASSAYKNIDEVMACLTGFLLVPAGYDRLPGTEVCRFVRKNALFSGQNRNLKWFVRKNGHFPGQNPTWGIFQQLLKDMNRGTSLQLSDNQRFQKL